MALDAHHHFWKYDPVEYDWIGENMKAIRRDFLPADLEREVTAAGVEGVISVQARQTLEETEWLLELARQHDFIKAVVGWVPLVSPDVHGHLERFAKEPKLRSVRHVLQGEPEGYMSQLAFDDGIRALRGFNLVYDLLVFEHQLPEAIQFVDRHPKQPFVLDHVAKPRIKAGALEPWKRHILELAKRDNVSCKVSGMVTEADWAEWTPDTLRPYFETVLTAFTPSRLMFGSDWPVCLVASDYARWVDTVRDLTVQLSGTEQQQIFRGAAMTAYSL